MGSGCFGCSRLWVVVFTCFTILPSHTQAEEDLEPETAKVVTEDALTVAKGDIEIELGFGYAAGSHYYSTSNHREDAPYNDLKTYEVGFTAGVAETVDLGLGIGWSDIHDLLQEPTDGDGVNDLSLGAKWNFFQSEDERFFLAYLPGVIIPTGDEGSDEELGPGQGFASFGNMLAFTAIFGQSNFNADIGYDMPFGEDRGTDRGLMVSDLALGYQIAPWFQPEIEINFEHHYQRKEVDGDLISATAGAILNLTDTFRLDLGVSQGIYGRNSLETTTLIVNASSTL